MVHGRWVNPYIVYLGRPSHDYPCDICHSKLCSAPSKWEGMVPATADMVEVVRCKDCKWRNTRGCPYMNFNAAVRDDSDYCSDGERKDNEQMDLEHCVKNAVAIICWTFLACHFGKWWIALFGALFLTSVEWGKKDND